MLTHRFELFRLLGFTVRTDWSWLLLAASVALSFGTWVFPSRYPEILPAQSWAMGAAVALGLAISILLHKLAHALMARTFGREIEAIGLFLVSDVLESEPQLPSPQGELSVALAGPAASLFAGGALALGWIWGATSEWSVAATAVAGYLATANLTLGLVNLLPAFPLDGGRALSAALWLFRGDPEGAARATSALGSALGVALLVFGITLMVSGVLPLGLTLLLGGMTLRASSQIALRQLAMRRTLAGEAVARFMKTDPVVVERAASVEQLVENFIYRHQHPLFPVVDGERLVGWVAAQHVQQLPRDEWDRQTVGSIAERVNDENTVSPATDALQALSLMNRGRTGWLMVAEAGRLMGVLRSEELLRFVALKGQLEGAPRPQTS